MGIRDFQAALKALGYDPGPIDGDFGPRTEAAAFASLGMPAPRDSVLSTSPAGVAALAAHEGFVPGPYKDSRGVWTAYTGHTAAAGAPVPADMPRGMPEDLDAALKAGFRVFKADLARYEADVRAALRVPVEQHEFDAAVSFHYNTGAIGRAEWVRKLNAGDRAGAAAAIMNWRSPAEIAERRHAEQLLFRDGVYPNKAMAVWPVTESGAPLFSRALRRIPADEIAGIVGAA
jgi:lysozyme